MKDIENKIIEYIDGLIAKNEIDHVIGQTMLEDLIEIVSGEKTSNSSEPKIPQC